MLVKLSQSIWHCNTCQQEFTVYYQSLGYGECLMYAHNGTLAYWNTLHDSTFDEYTTIAKKLLDGKVPENRLLGWINLTRGVCCDLAPDQSVYRIHPYCPNHEYHCVQLRYYVEPKQAQEFDLPEVTHQRWNGLSVVEKEQLVLAELRRWLPEL